MDATSLESRLSNFAAAHMPALSSRMALLAVSGGADSIATAGILCEAGIIEPARSAVAHFDHGLRGREAADRDLAAVEALCARYALPLIVERWCRPQRGEAAAREARYAFLRATASSAGLHAVATGHTSDDQVETIVLHLLRGSGVVGLQGMPYQRPLAPGIMLVRPAMSLAREDTQAYCAARDLMYTHDGTNEDMAFVRNRVRHRILPALERLMPDVRNWLLALSDHARGTVVAAEAAVGPAIAGEAAGTASLDRAFLRNLPEGLRANAIRLLYRRVVGDARELNRKHYCALQRAIDGRTGALIQLPRGVTARIDHTRLIMARMESPVPVIRRDFEAVLPFEGVVGAWSVSMTQVKGTLSGTAIPRGAVVRRRRPGDRVRLRAGTRKLQDVLVDAHIPRRERDGLPLIALGAEVFWAPCIAAVNATGPHPRYVITATHV